MGVIPHALLENQSKKINKISKALQKVLKQKLDAVEWNDISDLRNKTIDAIYLDIAAAVDMACLAESEFYDACRVLQIGEVLGNSDSYSLDRYALLGAIRAFVTDAEKGNYEGFVNKVLDRADYEIRKAAGTSTLQSAIKDKRVRKFARVPSGAETCVFCLMLASRGAVYVSEVSAGGDWNHYHSHCDCRIVPVYGASVEIEGFDSAALFQRYTKCRNTVEQYALDTWKSFSKEQQAQYKDFNDYLTKQILKEARRRDIEWLRDGKKAPNLTESGARLNKEEKYVVELLNTNGFSTIARETRSRESKRTSDLFIFKKPWEIKSPIGLGNQTIYHQFEEATGQSSYLVLDISRIEGDKEEKRKKIFAKVKKLIYYHYKDKKTGKKMQFNEVLIVDGEDYLVRIVREG